MVFFFCFFRSMGVRVCALWGHGRQAHVDDVSYRARSRALVVCVFVGLRGVWCTACGVSGLCLCV